MTPEAQRIAIAEAFPNGFDISFGTGVAAFRAWTNDGYWYGAYQGEAVTVDPLSDLNAMHEAEKVLTEAQRLQYVRTLVEVMFPQLRGVIFGLDAAYGWHLAHATAAQRAEAFLRTIGKWDDSK